MIVEDLKTNGPSTAAQIARRLFGTAAGSAHRDTMRVSSSLCWLRGNGWVSDGTTSTRVAVGNGMTTLAHTESASPVLWTYLARREDAPHNRVFHSESVEPLA